MKRQAVALVPIGLAVLAGTIGAVAMRRSEPTERVLATYGTPLEGRMKSQRHNAELSLRRLDGAVLGPHETFSFNKTVGTWTRDRGYRKAPVSYNGQLVNSWGGGVCQTSTTLYNAALLAGMDVLERHPHRFAPGYVPAGRDAAVAFDRIDLRFANPYPFPVRIEGRIERDRLVVRLLGTGPSTKVDLVQEVRQRREPSEMKIVGGKFGRVRNSGKPGYEVLIWRRVGEKRELVSRDDYPVMHRIVEYR